MPTTIRDASWESIEELRTRISATLTAATTLVQASQALVQELSSSLSTLALARVFVVAPFETLPAAERAVASEIARGANRPIAANTPVLTLLGTAGAEAAWNDRERSQGHRAIPLLDASFVEAAPMIASLLSSLDVDLEMLRGDASVQLRPLAGGLNARFYVPDARSAKDAAGRTIIGAQDFVAKHGVNTVFGMGGGFLNRMLTVVILFTREQLDALHIDRFASFIGTFKISTSKLVESGKIFS